MTARNQQRPTFLSQKLSAIIIGIVLLGIFQTTAETIGSIPPPLETPKGPVLLTVTGKITQKNRGDSAVFDLEMLDRLELGVIKTANPWIAGTNEYSGPKFSALLRAVGASGTNPVVVTALNDYVGKVPVDDIVNLHLILATRKNGKPLKIREKGPLFVVYPFSERQDIYDEVHFCRSVWQIKSIEIR